MEHQLDATIIVLLIFKISSTCKKSQSCAPEDGQRLAPKHVELILKINKTVIVASNWCSILTYQDI
jgi:hypothetical protein